jgi:hypothetical protein
MVRSQVALVGLFVGVAGACTTVRPVLPAEYLAANNPELVCVTYTNNTVLPVAEPEIKRDTLRGTLQGGRERVKIPLTEIRSVQAKVADHTKTAVLVTTLGVAAVTSIYFGLIANAGGAGPGDGVYCGTDVKGRPLPYC